MHAEPILVIITGQAGAGHSTSLKILEDSGFEAIDNLPPNLIPAVLLQKPEARLAIGIDSRTRDVVSAETIHLIEKLRADTTKKNVVVFLSCDDEVLYRRFTITRRRHPLHLAGGLKEAISAERVALQPLKNLADHAIDTSNLAPGALQHLLRSIFADEDIRAPRLLIQSFSYRNGIPTESDMVMDMRFLSNPYYQDELRHLNGKNDKIREFLENDPLWRAFFPPFLALTEWLLQAYHSAGKQYFTLAFGCTGGMHRSVFTAESVAEALRSKNWPSQVYHREL